MTNYPDSPREAARGFTPELASMIAADSLL